MTGVRIADTTRDRTVTGFTIGELGLQGTVLIRAESAAQNLFGVPCL